MKRFVQVVASLFESAAILALIWIGAFGGAEWASNVLRFYIWGMWAVLWFGAGLYILAAAKETMTEAPEIPAPLPPWARWPIRVATMFALAAAGWMFTALAYVGGLIAGGLIRAAVDQERKRTEKQAAKQQAAFDEWASKNPGSAA